MINVLISGAARAAVWNRSGELLLLRPEQANPRNLNAGAPHFIFDGADDAHIIQVKHDSDIPAALDVAVAKSKALRLVLAAFESHDDADLAFEAAKFVEKLFESDAVFGFVRNRLLAFVPSEDFLRYDPPVDFDRLSSLIAMVRSRQSAIEHWSSLWDALPPDLFDSQPKDAAKFFAADSGAFAALVLSASANEIQRAVFQAYSLKKPIPNWREIVKAWTQGALRGHSSDLLPARQSPEADTNPGEDSPNGHEIFQEVKRRQGEIVAALKSQDPARAALLTDNLVNYQLGHGSVKYVAKSLDRLAGIANVTSAETLELAWAIRATELCPNDGFAFCQLGDVLLRRGRIAEAEQAFEFARGCGQFAYGELGLARTKVEQGKFIEAIEAFQSLELTLPEADKAGAWAGHAIALRESGRSKEAFELMDAVAAGFPDTPVFVGIFASLLTDFGLSHRAISLLTHAISVHPDERQLRLALAAIYREVGNYDEAIRSYKEIVRRFDYEPLGLIGEAECLRIQKRWQEASSLVKRSLKTFGAHPAVLLEMMELLRSQRKFDEALGHLENIQHSGELGYRLALLRGAIYRAAGRKEEALRSYDLVTAQYPAFPGAWIGRGDVLRDFQEYDLAAAQYREVSTKWPYVTRARCALAATLVAQGRFPAAYEMLGPPGTSFGRVDWVNEHIRCNILLRKLAYEEVISRCDFALQSVEITNIRSAFDSLRALANIRLGRWEKAVESVPAAGSTFGAIIRLHAFALARRIPEAVVELDAIDLQAPEQERELAAEIAAQYDVGEYKKMNSVSWIESEEARLSLLQAA